MKLSRIISCLALVFLFLETSGQVILNGDFEDHNFSSCRYNLDNDQYTNSMNHLWGLGSGNELDVQNSACGYAEAPSNDWFVSLAKGFSGQYDELSLKMSEPVVEGKVYELTYFELAADTFENNLIPPEIGLSADSLSFGTVIHTSTLTDFDV